MGIATNLIKIGAVANGVNKLINGNANKPNSPINRFISEIKTGGLARTNRYSVYLNLPKSIPPISGSLDKILLLCDQVQLPAVSHSTIENRTFGEFREVPYERMYGDLSMSFYVDNDMYVKMFFDNWINSVSDPDTRTFNYYKEYTTDMWVNVEDLNNKARYQIHLTECYPKSIGSIQLDYSSKEVMKLSVQIQYKSWRSETLDPIDTGDNPSPTNFLDKYLKDFTGWQSKLPEGAQRLTGMVATYGVTKLPGLLKF